MYHISIHHAHTLGVDAQGLKFYLKECTPKNIHHFSHIKGFFRHWRSADFVLSGSDELEV